MNRPALKYLWIALLCCALAAAPWLGGQWTGVGPAVGRALVASAGLAWLVDRRGAIRLPRPALWLWAFAGWSVLTVIQQTSLHSSLLALSDLVAWAFLLMMAADASREAISRAVILVSTLGGCAVAAGMGVAHAVMSGPGWREFGSFATPNIFASYLATLFPLAFLTAVQALRKDAKAPDERRSPLNVTSVMVGIVAMTAAFTALLLTGSKGALGALVVAVLAVFAVAPPWKRLRGPMVVMAVLIMVFATGIGGRTVKGRVASAGTTESHSWKFRLYTWNGAARMAAAHPLMGTGIGTFGAAFNRYAVAGWTQAAHNAYLQTADETGIPGLILFVAALGSAALGLLKRARGGDLIACGALAGLVAAAVHNGVDYGWSLWGPSAIMWGLVGLGLGSEGTIAFPAWLKAVTGGAGVLTLAGGLLVANAAALSEPALDRTNTLTPDQRISALRSAASLDPLDGMLARELGIALAQTGDHVDALAALQTATRLSPNDAVAWRLYGEAQQNDPDAARSAFEKGLEVSPNSMKLLLDRARLEESAGQPAEALSLYNRLAAVAEGPVGRYPAIPEIVETEPLFAYAALAGDADRRRDITSADKYRRALVTLADRYIDSRQRYEMLWKATGKDDPRELDEVRNLRDRALAQ